MGRPTSNHNGAINLQAITPISRKRARRKKTRWTHHHVMSSSSLPVMDKSSLVAVAVTLVVLFALLTVETYRRVSTMTAPHQHGHGNNNNNNNNNNSPNTAGHATSSDPSSILAASRIASAAAVAAAAARLREQGKKNDAGVLSSSSSSSESLRQRPHNNADAIDRLRHHTFPMHATEMEVIPHPGLAYTIEQLKRPHKIPPDLPVNITVPRFFDDVYGPLYDDTGSSSGNSSSGGRPPSIRHYLGDDGRRLMTVEEAMSIGSFTTINTKNRTTTTVGSTDNNNNNNNNADASDTDTNNLIMIETIYVAIASYRDPECQRTVEDLYARAKFPERIRVAIIDQRDVNHPNSHDPICHEPAEPCDVNPKQAMCRYQHLIDNYEMDGRYSVGPVFARHLSYRHYRGEYFAMQLDSHVRFVVDWDETIVRYWESAKNEMAVLTTYPSRLDESIDPTTHKGIRKGRPIMCQTDYETGVGGLKHLRGGVQPERVARTHGEPTLEPYWAAGFSFARGHFAIQVPYDQYLPMVFQGEEISITLRGFSYGYDYYSPEESVLFHMYALAEFKERRKKVPLFWEHANLYVGAGQRAMKRLNSIIHMEDFPDTEWDHTSMDRYGLGQVRTTEKFFKTFGIHTDTHTVEENLCKFVGKPMMKEFLPSRRENRLGLDYDKINYVYTNESPKSATKPLFSPK